MHVHVCNVVTIMIVRRFADMAAVLILPPRHPLMLIKMIYSFYRFNVELSQ